MAQFTKWVRETVARRLGVCLALTFPEPQPRTQKPKVQGSNPSGYSGGFRIPVAFIFINTYSTNAIIMRLIRKFQSIISILNTLPLIEWYLWDVLSNCSPGDWVPEAQLQFFRVAIFACNIFHRKSQGYIWKICVYTITEE